MQLENETDKVKNKMTFVEKKLGGLLKTEGNFTNNNPANRYFFRSFSNMYHSFTYTSPSCTHVFCFLFIRLITYLFWLLSFYLLLLDLILLINYNLKKYSPNSK